MSDWVNMADRIGNRNMLHHRQKVFIDCGSNTGQGLVRFTSMYGMDESWVVEAFEPNPDLIGLLECNTKDMPMSISIYNRAVWDMDGEVNFSIMIEESEGSSVNKLMDSGICADESSLAYRKHDTIITVPCSNISTVLNRYSSNDYIVVKLDVEGSEFCIIRKMIVDNTIKIIKDLYVEWHTPLLSSETQQSQNLLTQQIKEHSVKLHDWH